jgi:hypothetical protein
MLGVARSATMRSTAAAKRSIPDAARLKQYNA